MSDDIEKARAAHAALVAAKAACDAAGLVCTLGWQGDDALPQCIAKAAAHVTSMERRALPIAFGDTVTVTGINDRRGSGPRRARVESIGRTLIHLGDDRAYYIENGRWNDRQYGSHYHIDADDLARIKRDLAGKRPPKPAPVMREVGTVTKGDDE